MDEKGKQDLIRRIQCLLSEPKSRKGKKDLNEEDDSEDSFELRVEKIEAEIEEFPSQLELEVRIGKIVDSALDPIEKKISILEANNSLMMSKLKLTELRLKSLERGEPKQNIKKSEVEKPKETKKPVKPPKPEKLKPSKVNKKKSTVKEPKKNRKKSQQSEDKSK